MEAARMASMWRKTNVIASQLWPVRFVLSLPLPAGDIIIELSSVLEYQGRATWSRFHSLRLQSPFIGLWILHSRSLSTRIINLSQKRTKCNPREFLETLVTMINQRLIRFQFEPISASLRSKLMNILSDSLNFRLHCARRCHWMI